MRLGTVPYVNAAPLLWGLQKDAGIEVVARPPSRLARLLEKEELDGAILPVVELLRHPQWERVSTSCIATRGNVQSVLLFLKRGTKRLRRVALDPHSRTSQMLTRLVVRRLSGQLPHCFEADPREALERDDCDAVLAIGDLALRLRSRGLPYLDLGLEWVRQMDQPFVFAVWVTTPAGRSRHPELASILDASRDCGEAAISAVVEENAQAGLLPPEELRLYLTQAIRYRLAPPEQAGMKLFLAQVRDLS